MLSPACTEPRAARTEPSRDRIRLLFVDHSPFQGGAQLALADHLEALDRGAFRISVACTEDEPALVRRFRSSADALHLIPMPRLKTWDLRFIPGLFMASWKLRRIIRADQIDVVVANTSRAAYLCALANVGTRARLVWWVRDFFFGRRFVKLFDRSAARIVCVSAAIRDYYSSGSGARYEVVRLGNTMAARAEAVTTEQVRHLRAKWGIGPDEIVIGFMGRLVSEKGPQVLLDAVCTLHQRFPNARLLLVGTGHGQAGSVEAALKERVAGECLDFVRFCGYQEDEAGFYRAFDVFVLPSVGPEALATSVIQAMMARCPVVATDTGGTSEVVHNGETGLLVRPNDRAGLVHALTHLLADAELRTRLADAGYAFATRHHSQQGATAAMASLYRTLA